MQGFINLAVAFVPETDLQALVEGRLEAPRSRQNSSLKITCMYVRPPSPEKLP